MLFRQFHCRDCGSLVGYRSRPRTFAEKYILPVLLLRPVRCGDCFRRYYRLFYTEVRERHESGITHKAAA
jgi:hypothetical protein